MNIAVEGCLHGELEQVYLQLSKMQKDLNVKIDLLIICGDFQALRDQTDLDYMHCPQKYKAMGSFYKYFQSIKEPPVLTIFIGGNHQAVNYMRGLYFGGWVAKNIYYLGQAGSIYVKKGNTKIRITGMSGIYNHRDFLYSLRPERIPLYGGAKISAYHIKQLQIYRLELLSRIGQMKKEQSNTYGNQDSNFDIYLSHDWPKNIALYGKISQLYKYKPFLQKEINNGQFGSPPGQRLMKLAKPAYWFSAHMHIKYAALYPHSEKQYTHFLSLDKCLQKRSCMQILNFKNVQSSNVDKKQQAKIYIDLSWLTVLKLTQNLQNKGEVLYSYENSQKQFKVCNSKMMNELIQNYPEAYLQLKQRLRQKGILKQQKQLIEVSACDFSQQNENEYKQTEQILQMANLKKYIFQGTIFPKGYFSNHDHQIEQINEKKQDQKKIQILEKKEQNINDEIQLDL